jgi:hypothetical protein
LGLVTGAVIFGLTYQNLMPGILKVANLGSVVMPDLWGLNPLLVVGVFVVFIGMLFYFLENGWVRKDRLE